MGDDLAGQLAMLEIRKRDPEGRFFFQGNGGHFDKRAVGDRNLWGFTSHFGWRIAPIMDSLSA